MNFKKTLSLIAVPIFLIFFIPTISADSTEIPSWVKGVANFWVEGNIDDSEFGESLSFLIEQGIIKVEMPQQANTGKLEREITQLESENAKLKNENTNLIHENAKLKLELSTSDESKSIPTQDSGFSDLICKQEYGVVKMSGRYTNDNKPTQGVMLKLILLDANNKIVATGIGSITEMNAHETKYFDAVAFYEGNYSSCDVQIEFK